MSLITIMDASLAYGADQLLSHADLSVEEHERICLVGRNGAGKSTLLKVIAGERELDDGRIVLSGSLRITGLEQDPPEYTKGTAYTLAASKIPVVGEALARFSQEEDPDAQARLASFIEQNDGWKQDGEIRKLLSNIGIDPDLPLKSLSGGWRRKAALASALVTSPDVLLLEIGRAHV